MSSREDPMQKLLKQVAGDRERILDEAARGAAPAFEDAVLKDLRTRLGVGRRRSTSAWLPALAAAALLLAVGVWFSTRGDQERPQLEIELGSGAIVPLTPVGRVATFDEFRWRVTASHPPRYVLAVESAMPGEEGTELLRRSVSTDSVRLTPAELARFPARIAWRVTWLGPSGDRVDSASASAWR
ncbi:MAG: hypothetical protein IPH13_14650 [Planctomycetes bacterium]|nr:hypothetical protein [Planctomycetota bacterium]